MTITLIKIGLVVFWLAVALFLEESTRPSRYWPRRDRFWEDRRRRLRGRRELPADKVIRN